MGFRCRLRRRLLVGLGLGEPLPRAHRIISNLNVTDRLADTFGFSVDDRAAIRAGAKYLLARGYG